MVRIIELGGSRVMCVEVRVRVRVRASTGVG